MFIAVDDRRLHIQITRELEKVLSNTEVRELSELIVPLFREKKYGEGITKCVDAFIEVLKEKRGKTSGKTEQVIAPKREIASLTPVPEFNFV